MTLVILFTSLIFKTLNKKATARFLLITALLFLWITSTPIFSRPVVYWLEKQNNPLIEIPDSLKHQPVNILVLGGGHTNNRAIPYTAQLNYLSLGRLVEGLRLYQQLPESRLILSGYSGKEPLSHAKTLLEAAQELVKGTLNFDTLPEPHNTHAEAFYYSKRYSNCTPLILVTDAIHMPRALRYFYQYGIHPIPAPVNFILKSDKFDWRSFSLPSGTTIVNLERVFHEYIGLLWQDLGGK